MKKNIIYMEDCIEGMRRQVKDETVDLLIADPPYFKVVGQKWDYKWRTEEDYIEWSKKWIKEAFKVLRYGGSLYLFGYFRMLARLIPTLEENGFKLRQQIVINKGIQAISGRATKNYKMFPNVTESVLFLVKDPIPFSRKLLKSKQKEIGLKAKEINELLGVKSNGGGMWSIYTGNNIGAQLPTKDYWHKLENILKFNYPYEKLAITFNTQLGLTDVWEDINFYKEKRIHPTQKPLSLIKRLIFTSSNENDLVLDPFMGSGSTAIGCIKTNRTYLGFESDELYYQKSIERIKEETEQEQLSLRLL